MSKMNKVEPIVSLEAPSEQVPVSREKDLKYLKDRDQEKVKGVFRFYEVPGGKLEFTYKKYKGEKVEKYVMNDGEICTIPRGVAVHLNKNGWYRIHEFRTNEHGERIHSPLYGKKIHRFGFSSLEFVDVGDYGETGLLYEPVGY